MPNDHDSVDPTRDDGVCGSQSRQHDSSNHVLATLYSLPYLMMNRAAADPPVIAVVGTTLALLLSISLRSLAFRQSLSHGHAANRSAT